MVSVMFTFDPNKGLAILVQDVLFGFKFLLLLKLVLINQLEKSANFFELLVELFLYILKQTKTNSRSYKITTFFFNIQQTHLFSKHHSHTTCLHHNLDVNHSSFSCDCTQMLGFGKLRYQRVIKHMTSSNKTCRS